MGLQENYVNLCRQGSRGTEVGSRPKRHDINDLKWALLVPHIPEQCGQWNGIAKDKLKFINCALWLLRSEALQWDLPPCCGISVFVEDETKAYGKIWLWYWLMIDASHGKVHSHTAGVKGSNQNMGRTKDGSTLWFTLLSMHSSVYSWGLTERFLIQSKSSAISFFLALRACSAMR